MIVFEATVQNNENGGWFIELKDTLNGRFIICADLKDFETKIQKLAEPYGGRVEEVKWLSGEGLKPESMQEVRIAMMEYHEKYKDQLDDKKENN